MFYMHNGHRKQAARDWVKKGQKGRPQTGGVRENMKSLQARYLDRLAELYPTIAAASTEIINLESILNLPKGTEHFLTDIHGEYEAFSHVLKNGSGSVKRKIDDVFGNTLSRQDKQSLATLIYYPAEKMSRILQTEKNPDDWYKITLYRLIAVCRRAASKYTRSKIRKALPKEFAYVLEELLTERGDLQDKESYYDAIVQTIVRVGRAKAFIIALSELIQRLTVDHLHIEHLVLFAAQLQNTAFKINMMQKISFLQAKFRMTLDDLPFRLELDDRDRLVHLLVHLALRRTVRVTTL